MAVAHYPHFSSALYEARRWIDQLGQLHEQALAGLRMEASGFREQAQFQEQELVRLRAEVASLRAKVPRTQPSSARNAPSSFQPPPRPPPVPQGPPVQGKQQRGGGRVKHQEESIGKEEQEDVLGEYIGTIKAFYHDKGFGFIACDELKEYSTGNQKHPDIYLNVRAVGDFPVHVGAQVRFEAYLHKGQLQARCLQDATGMVEPPSSRSGGSGLDMESVPTREIQPPQSKDHQEEVLGEYYGFIKAFDAEKLRGWIACDSLKDHMPGSQRDVHLHRKGLGDFPARIGAAVSFEAYLHKGQLQARSLQDATGMVEPQMAMDVEALSETAADNEEEILGEYDGIIKSFNHDKGFGFITCDELKEFATEGKRSDVYLNIRNVGDFPVQVGAEVRFEAYLHKGQLQARYLQDAMGMVETRSAVSGGSASVAAHSAVSMAENNLDEVLGDYYGVIKSYNLEKQFGFITCDALKEYSGGKDVYLHRTCVGDFPVQAGTEVLFEAYVHKGQLQARALRVPSTGENQDERILGEHVGTIKTVNAEKGFAFITCIGGSLEGDVYVYPKSLGNLQVAVGDEVKFQAYMHKGRLQGRCLQHVKLSAPPPPPPVPLAGGPSKKRKQYQS